MLDFPTKTGKIHKNFKLFFKENISSKVQEHLTRKQRLCASSVHSHHVSLLLQTRGLSLGVG